MKALTVRQPWAAAIVYGAKDVENRSKAPPLALLGQKIAIHAGLTIAVTTGHVPMETFLERVGDTIPCELGRVIGHATILGWYGKGHDVGNVKARVLGSAWYDGENVGILLGKRSLCDGPEIKGQVGYWTL